MRGNTDRVNLCTTGQFDGLVAVIQPEDSWVARWKRIGAFTFSSTCLLLADYVGYYGRQRRTRDIRRTDHSENPGFIV